MWLQAQEKVRTHLTRLGARLVGNAALVDECGTVASFLSTPLWMLTGKRGPFPLGIPRGGVPVKAFPERRRFGAALSKRLTRANPLDKPACQGGGPGAGGDN